MRLQSVEHAGLFVSTRSTAQTRELLTGLPHSLLLGNEEGQSFVLLSATTLPSRPALQAVLFSTGND